jgi:hypothetical protein
LQGENMMPPRTKRPATPISGHATPRAVHTPRRNPRAAVRCISCVRVRPLLAAERSAGQAEVWRTAADDSGGGGVSLERAALEREGRAEWLADTAFTYDHVFGPEASTAEVFATVAAPLVPSVLDGVNCTLVAYGQTASGKTTTMLGCAELAFRDLLGRARTVARDRASPRTVSFRASCCEVYNEQCNDLLSAGGTGLRLYERGGLNGGVLVGDLSSTPVANLDEAVALLRAAEAQACHIRKAVVDAALHPRRAMQRRVGSTSANDRSSRSHLIFTLVAESWPARDGDSDGDARSGDGDGGDGGDGDGDGGEGVVRAACLQLVDLAGSERAHAGSEALREEGS